MSECDLFWLGVGGGGGGGCDLFLAGCGWVWKNVHGL